jgi:predicted PurR-regulated permease PerM
LVVRGAAYAWRLLAIGAALAAALWLLGQLLVVVMPVAVVALLTRALAPIAGWLRRHGWRPGLVALTTVLGALLILGAVFGVAGASVVSELGGLGTTLGEGVDDVERWLVEDSPFDVSRADVRRWRDQAADALSSFVSSGNRSLATGALLAAELAAGACLRSSTSCGTVDAWSLARCTSSLRAAMTTRRARQRARGRPSAVSSAGRSRSRSSRQSPSA